MSRRVDQKQSTNPFDDDNNDDVNWKDRCPKLDHQIEEHEQVANEKLLLHQRQAPLNFFNPLVDDEEQPALTFDSANRPVRAPSTDDEGFFISPLRAAMKELDGPPNSRKEEEEDLDELSALLDPEDGRKSADYDTLSPSMSGRSRRYRHGVPKEIHTGTYSNNPHPSHDHEQSRRQRTKTTNHASNIVMTELATTDTINEVVEYKYILLEDLGTASSWFILLLPYLAFALSMILEYATSFSVSTIGPIQATDLCSVERIYEVTHRVPSIDRSVLGPSMETYSGSCYASFSMRTLFDERYRNSSWAGTAFDSGIIGKMPVIGNYLNGEATFSNLTVDSLAMVTQGRVKFFVLILEQMSIQSSTNDTQDGPWDWTPLFLSPTSKISMTCRHNSRDEYDAHFDCKTNDLILVAFSVPTTAVYTGGNLRFLVFYEHVGAVGVSAKTSRIESQDLLRRNATIATPLGVNTQTNISDFDQLQSFIEPLTERSIQDPSLVLEEMVSKAAYIIQYRSRTTVLLDTIMRSISFTFSIGFIIFWCRQMGIQCYPGWKCIYCCLCGAKAPNDVAKKYWWEDPWVLFPERYYILVLLFSLLLVQEPFLVVIYIFPHTRSNTMHMIADAAIGIGVQGILLVYLCLFEGLRYHTADRSKRRAERQRQALQLRRAVKLVGGAANKEGIDSPAAIEHYYNEFGDIDGSAFTSHLRLPSDPLGDGWGDFLIPKLCVWVIGVVCVSTSAYCRFFMGYDSSDSDPSKMSFYSFTNVEILYIVCSVTQVLTILLWIYLIIVALSKTGEVLKREPFLATRPAQLSYRVLLAHIVLVITAMLISFILYIWHLQNDWYGESIDVSVAQRETSVPGLIAGALQSAIMNFPYSGTAATVGFGRLLCVTVEILITAFIFLPAHSLDTDDDDACEDHQGLELRNYLKNKRDKRTVVLLAKESKTWRIFPCPIQQLDTVVSPLQDSMFQIYKDLHTDRTMRERGLVSIGPYTPVFCNEIACWLNEASWQAYYTPPGSSRLTEKDDFIGWMNLDALGLRLEGYVYDERTNAQALIATNMVPQVDGDVDSIIVVAFRGTSNVAHMQIDIRMRQVSRQGPTVELSSLRLEI
jgi:hypothetical protein